MIPMNRVLSVLAMISFAAASVGCDKMAPAPELQVKLSAFGEFSLTGPEKDAVLGRNGTEKQAYLRVREAHGKLVAEVFEKASPAAEPKPGETPKPPVEIELFELDLPAHALAMAGNVRGPLETQYDENTLHVRQKGEAVTIGDSPFGPVAEAVQAESGLLRVKGERHLKYANGYLEHGVSGRVSVVLMDASGKDVARFDGLTTQKGPDSVYVTSELEGLVVGDEKLGGGRMAKIGIALPKGIGTITQLFSRRQFTFDIEKDVIDPRGRMDVLSDGAELVVVKDRLATGLRMNGIDLGVHGQGQGDGRFEYDFMLSVSQGAILLQGKTSLSAELVSTQDAKASFKAEKAVYTALEW